MSGTDRQCRLPTPVVDDEYVRDTARAEITDAVRYASIRLDASRKRKPYGLHQHDQDTTP